MIRLESIDKTFQTANGPVHAVNDVTLEIQDGKIYGIIGFSGAGKSTLVRCINLLERPDSGAVYFEGQDLLKLSDKELRKERQKMGMIFQHFNLMPSRTIYENIAFPLRHLHYSKDRIQKKVDELLKLIDLSDRKDAYPSQLSGGQKQRVAIARALASDPKVLLCDEATSALDPHTTKQILSLIKEINRKMNLTVIMITHEMAVVKEICDRVAIMEHGKVIEEGEIYDVFSNPKEDVTRNFVGTTNNLSKLQDLIEAGDSFVSLKPGQKMIKLTYGSTSEALISKISREYAIDCSIVHGDVEIVHEQPFGVLVCILDGRPERVERALDFLKEQNVKVEVMKDA